VSEQLVGRFSGLGSIPENVPRMRWLGSLLSEHGQRPGAEAN